MKVLNSTAPYNMFGLEEQDYDTAKVVILPVPYDATSSYRTGSRDGPRAMIEASRPMELYDQELDQVTSDNVGIFTLEELAPDFNSPEGMVNRIAKEVGIIIDDKKVPVLLGGEHTIAIGAVKAFASRRKDFSVLHFDAHADSRDEFNSTKYSHACVMARIREMCNSCYSVGIRSIDKDSAEKYEKQILYMKDMNTMKTKQVVDLILKNTKKNIYITIDLDVIDPSEMPSTGTPEPDGLCYSWLKLILKGILKERNLIGADFNELNPIPGIVAPNVLAAKLVYSTIGYAFA